ncbi:hypothetical protein [Neptunomonas japonica]|uniref:hypothetical protein n=1 Tax=Neptunomonas japonica TaxID=417574 RepID=UPI0003FBC970|nr:hypothetical protein [Neptunomonas japonica]
MNRKIQAIKSIATNKVFGWKTKRKLLVIESDDWGAIRTSSKEAYDRLSILGYDMTSSCYNLDSLETNEDLEALYNVLNKYKDINNRPVCFTANIVTANPDFQIIKDSGYKNYGYESVINTCLNTSGSENVVELWKQGFNENVFFPQLHCREHLRFWEWMDKLSNNCDETLTTFHLGMCGLPVSTSKNKTSFFRTPYIKEDYLKKKSLSSAALIKPAFEIFERIFGFRPSSVVAPNVGWTSETESIWEECGIKFIQGGKVQIIDNIESKKFLYHYLGQSNNKGMLYLVRNCTFEPAKGIKFNHEQAFFEVNKAFNNDQPAIVSTHRVNYVGKIKPENRDHSLKELEMFLSSIVNKWPDVEFITSCELGELIANDHNSKKVGPIL